MSKQPVSASYNRYGPWLRAKFGGERVHKVVIDAGFSCPNRDGSKGHGGCAYCNVESFPLFTLPQYTDFLCEFLPRLRPDIVIQRLFGLADPELLIAPKWELGKSAVQRFIDRTLAQRGIVQGSAT